MKRGIIAILLLSASVMAVSCVEESSKYRSLVAQKDSLSAAIAELEANYNETIDILNFIEENFSDINQTEGEVVLNIDNIENQPESRKKQIAGQVELIRQSIESSKAKIKQLESKLNAGGRTNTALKKAIARLESELAAKEQSLDEMQQELAKNNIKIETMEKSIDSLSQNIAELGEQNSQKDQIIDKMQNTVWYCLASSKDLQDYGIVSRKNIFSKKQVLAGEFDKTAFTEADLRTFTSLEINSSKIKLLSQHPEGSYSIEKEGDMIHFRILDNNKFWSVMRYLVIEI